MKGMVIAAGGLRYGLLPAELRAVTRHPTVGELPFAPAGVLGLTLVRGEVVPLVDPGTVTGNPPVVTPVFAVMVETSRGLAALASDGQPDWIELDGDEGADVIEFDVEALLTPARLRGR